MTLQEMIDRQAPAETLVLHPANQEFNGPIVLRQPLTLQGRGATIRAAHGPLMLVESAGVTLQNLHLEITSDQRLKDEEALALLVQPGIVISTSDISLRGNVFGIAGEEGRWHYPNSIRLGNLEPDREHAFQLRLGLPVACKMVCDIDGVRVEPDVFSGYVMTDIRLQLDAMPARTHLRGRILITTRTFTRQILIAGNTARIGSGIQGNGRIIFDCMDPNARLACSVVDSVREEPFHTQEVAEPDSEVSETRPQARKRRSDAPEVHPEVRHDSGAVGVHPPVRITNSMGMQLVQVPAGEFLMGSTGTDTEAVDSEKPQHKVRITKSFFLGIYPVTQEQYQRVAGRNPSHFRNPKHPVERVSWDEAVEFCRRLSALSGERDAERVYRLPTEAEWEYACRAGRATRFHPGDDAAQLLEYAWFDLNSGARTHPVGQKKPSAWGMYDMHGNVWEWCSDWFGNYDSGNFPVDDPAGPDGGSYRVFRGGSWRFSASLCRSAYRRVNQSSHRSREAGFRVVAVLKMKPS